MKSTLAIAILYSATLVAGTNYSLTVEDIDAVKNVKVDVKDRVLDVVKDFTQNNDAYALSTCGAQRALRLAIADGTMGEEMVTRGIDIGSRSNSPSPVLLGRRGMPLKEELEQCDVFTDSACDTFQGNFIADVDRRQEAIKQLVGSIFDGVIETMEKNLEHGALPAGASNQISPVFSEEAIKKRVYEALILELLSAEHCFAKCVYSVNQTETINRGHKIGNEESFMAKYRFVEDGNRVCQWECLSHDKNPRETELPGIDKFASYDLDFASMSTAAFKAWKSGVQVARPICDSQFNVLNDLWSNKTDFITTMMPGCCGDWRCNETKPFMEALKMSNVSDPAFKTYYQRQIPTALHQTVIRPYTHFNALCQLNMSYPQWSWYKSSPLQQGAHWACEALQEETRDMDEDHANFHFCKDSEVGKEVQDTTGRIRSMRLGPDDWIGFKSMCKDELRLPNPKCMRTDDENFAARNDHPADDAEYLSPWTSPLSVFSDSYTFREGDDDCNPATPNKPNQLWNSARPWRGMW